MFLNTRTRTHTNETLLNNDNNDNADVGLPTLHQNFWTVL